MKSGDCDDALGAVELSVIIPAYREARHLRYNLSVVCRSLDELRLPYEVIVVDDGSGDGTYREAIQAAETHPAISVYSLDENGGKGIALLAGAHVSRGDMVAFLDADLDLHPRMLGRFVEIMRESGGDAVIGSKWHAESRVDYPPLRRLYSRVYYSLVHLLFDLPTRDTQTGIKLFKRDALMEARRWVVTARYAFDLDLLVTMHRLGYRIVDAPVELAFQRVVGRIRFEDVAHILLDTFMIFFRGLRPANKIPSPRIQFVERSRRLYVGSEVGDAQYH